MLCMGSKGYAQPMEVMAKHEGELAIKHLEQLNSPYEERSLFLTANGKKLFFQSLRGGQSWTHTYVNWAGDTLNDGDIWVSQKENAQWLPPEPLPYGINTSSGEGEPVAIKNGKLVYYHSWNFQWEYTEGPYYRVKKKGKRWKRIQGLGGNITEFFRQYSETGGMAISQDQKIFIVVARRPEQADKDLYISRRGAFGWSDFERLDLSTQGDEESVFLAPDGRTLYFASTGYHGLGGLDIYKTVLSADGSFGAIINLGSPINSCEDDHSFVVSEDGAEAYFVRHGDIHQVILKAADPIIKPIQ